MIPLFSRDFDPGISRAVSPPPQWHYVQEVLKKNVQTVVSYYRQNEKPYGQVQFLMRLLQTLDVPMQLPLKSYYRSIDDKALNFSMGLQMTSSLYKGKAFSGEFFDTRSTEYYIATDDFFDYEYADKNWREVRAVSFITHPKSDLELVLPGAKQAYSAEAGLVVLLINIPMLAVQYRAFSLSQADSDVGPESTQQFIEKYVLPNMLYSQTEIALFNRFYQTLMNEVQSGTGNSTRDAAVAYRHPFSLIDLQPRLDQAMKQVVENYSNTDPVFEKLLLNTPALYRRNLLDALQLPDLAPTSQVQWLLFASRLKAFVYAIQAAQSRTSSYNQDTMNTLMRIYRANAVPSMVEANFPAELSRQFNTDIQTLTQYFNSNAKN